MRIRQVRPEFFTDAVIAGLPVPVRLTYIGLWCVADDAGWLRWNVATIGAVLYPFDTPGKRQKHLTEAFEALSVVGRLQSFDCGCVYIPTLSVHQKIGGTKATPAKDYHDKGHREWAPRPDLRTLVFRRDNYSCRYCGVAATEDRRMLLEHVINGGPTDMENCVTACHSCNVRKGKRTLEEAGMALLPVPVGPYMDASGSSQTDTPVKVGNGSNGRLETRERETNDEDDRPARLAAFRRQGLPVDIVS